MFLHQFEPFAFGSSSLNRESVEPKQNNKYLIYLHRSKSKSYSTQYSQVVPHPSTNYANTSLTSEIRRDPVLSCVYGHNQRQRLNANFDTTEIWTPGRRLTNRYSPRVVWRPLGTYILSQRRCSTRQKRAIDRPIKNDKVD